jgi:outer membrane protein
MSRHYLRATILTASLGLAAALPASAADAAAAPAAPGPARPSINLSITQAIEIALQKNFNVQLQNLSLANSKETYNSAKLEYKPTMSVSAASNGSQNAATGTAAAASDHVDSQSISASVSQKIPTGATVSLTSTFLSRANTANSPTTPSFGRALTLTVSQPLLKGAGTKFNLTALRNSKISLDQSFLSYKTFLITTVQSIENAYTSLMLAQDQLNIGRQTLALAKTTYDEQVTRKNAGLITDIALIQAENTYLQSQNTLYSRELALRSAEDALRLLLGGQDYDIGINPTDDLSTEQLAIPTVESSYRLALENGADYKNRKFAVQTAESAVFTAKNSLKPTLNVVGSVTTSDTGVANWGSTYRRISENSNYGWSLALTLNVPLGERNDRITYRRNLNSLESAKIQLTQYEQETLVSVRNAVNTIATSQKSLDLSAKQVVLAERTYEADKQRFEVGSITPRALTQSLTDLENQRLALVQAKLNLRTAVYNLRRIEQTTLDRYNIKLPE